MFKLLLRWLGELLQLLLKKNLFRPLLLQKERQWLQDVGFFKFNFNFVNLAATTANNTARPGLTAQQEAKYREEIGQLKDQVNFKSLLIINFSDLYLGKDFKQRGEWARLLLPEAAQVGTPLQWSWAGTNYHCQSHFGNLVQRRGRKWMHLYWISAINSIQQCLLTSNF